MLNRPSMDEILRDPAIYRHFRRQGVDIMAGRIGGLVRLLWTGPWLGWRWFLAFGPWRVRPTWLRLVWWSLPLVLGLWWFHFSVMGLLSMYFWFPLVAGWVWSKRINAYAARSDRKSQYDEIEKEINEINEMQAPAYDDPSRLKS